MVDVIKKWFSGPTDEYGMPVMSLREEVKDGVNMANTNYGDTCMWPDF